MELHIFDFDGTIFNSPTPSARLKTTQGSRVYGQLMRPLQDNGLGWFQSLSTLSPPAVPEKPEEEKWYIAPVLARIRQLNERRRDDKLRGDPESVQVYVLTGRDEKYRRRITALLDNVGLLGIMNGVFLKPSETYGTVKYKLETMYTLLAKHQPTQAFYYEDRMEQGQKLLGGIRRLSDVVNKKSSGTGFVSTLMLHPDGSLCRLEPDPLNSDDANIENCNAAKRWWNDVCRRIDPYPLSSVNPFWFTLVFLDPELPSCSDRMLTAKEEDLLVSELRYEGEAYRAANPTKARSTSDGPRGLRKRS